MRKTYGAGYPHTLSALLAWSGRSALAPAVTDERETLTRGGFQNRVLRVAAGLRQAGIVPGSRVALWLPNGADYLAAIFACARLGALAIHINTRFRAAEVGSLLRRTRAVALVTEWGFAPVDFPAIFSALPDADRAPVRCVLTPQRSLNVAKLAGLPVLPLEAEAADAGPDQASVAVRVRTGEGERTIEGSDILVAAGRVPNTAGIGLEQTGVEMDARGYIRVNERLETTAAGIWALGECAGSPQFTHVSEDDFRIVRDNLAGGNRDTRHRLIPYCMFTDPPLAHVGLSERDAERQGIVVRLAKLSVDSVLRAQATGEREGFMKVLVGEKDDRIVGFTMIGAAAGEVMAVVQTAMLAGVPYGKLANAVLAHPTMAEGLGMLLSNVPRRSVAHTPERAA